MTKDVLLTMKGMQFELNEATGETENIEIITAAQYYNKGAHSYITFEEIMEGFDRPVTNMVRLDRSSVEVTKKGVINVHMVFEEGKQNLTNYQTPYGNIVIGINTKKIRIEESEELIRVEADYTLDVNYEFLADCRISINITPREAIHLI